MLTSNDPPLTIARQVLQPASIAAFRMSPFNFHGWKILDRWAFNSPEKLRALEATGLIALLSRVLDQQHTEMGALIDAMRHSEGLAEHEVLTMQEIRTEL
jgi:hypothetical protein